MCQTAVYMLEESLNLSENAVKVLERRYLKRDKDGNCVEKPADMFRRVADTIASGDLQFGKSQSDVKILSDRFYKSDYKSLLYAKLTDFDECGT